MRIAFCPNVNVPTRAAEGLDVMKRCQWFSKIGNEVTLFVPNVPGPESDQDPYMFYGMENIFGIVKLPWVGVPGKRLLCGYLAARGAKRKGADLVYARSVYAAYFAAGLGIDVILESHNPIRDEGRMPEWVFRRIRRSGGFKRLVVITGALKEYFEERYGLDGKMIMVAPSGADPAEEVEPMSLGSDRFSVGYVGHLYPGKGMEVVGMVSKLCPWADFHVVGGTEVDIQRWKSELVGNPNVIFHGYVLPSETVKYRAAFDVLVVPNQRTVSIFGGGSDIGKWTSPLKLFEYMSAGKPIICSDLPVLREVVVDGETALLCDPEKAEDWAEALIRLRDDEDLRGRLGASARREFLASYTWEVRAKKVLSGLKESG
ncbi:MAG: glycosyltransferase family 4 protein [Deferrisomatales bacterium]|nr:glycosyltransferase family 4 protein [Deferrisomatales bacterium]